MKLSWVFSNTIVNSDPTVRKAYYLGLVCAGVIFIMFTAAIIYVQVAQPPHPTWIGPAFQAALQILLITLTVSWALLTIRMIWLVAKIKKARGTQAKS